MKKYRKVILVAGHSNSDPGAVSGLHKESVLTRKDRDGVRYFLEKHYPDIEVLVDDDSKNLSEVIRWIKSVEGDNSIIYDFHRNSAANNKATGVESFIADGASKKSRQMGDGFNKVVHDITGMPNRGTKTESESKRGRLGILHTKSPAVIVELGFLNNPEDRVDIEEWGAWIYEDVAHDIAIHAIIK